MENNVKQFRKRGEPSLRFEWIGGASGYIWVGTDRTSYLTTLNAKQAKSLMQYISKRLKGKNK